MRKLAVDANILVRNATRRLIVGVAEVSECAVVVPATASRSAKEVYRKVVGAQKGRQIEHEMMLEGKPTQGEEARRRLTERLDNAESGFAAWLEREPKVNSGLMEIAESTEKRGMSHHRCCSRKWYRTRRTNGTAREKTRKY